MKKILAWLVLLSVTFCIGLGYWHLAWQTKPPAAESLTAAIPAPQNIDGLIEHMADIFNRGDFRIDVSNPNNLLIIVHNRLVLKFGQPVDLDKKYEALVTVLGAVKDDLPKIQYIDISAYRTPAVR